MDLRQIPKGLGTRISHGSNRQRGASRAEQFAALYSRTLTDLRTGVGMDVEGQPFSYPSLLLRTCRLTNELYFSLRQSRSSALSL